MSVTFFGHGLVFHPTKNRVMCQFRNGTYTTSDPDEIAILAKTFDHEDALPEEVVTPESETTSESEKPDKPRRGRPRNV